VNSHDSLLGTHVIDETSRKAKGLNLYDMGGSNRSMHTKYVVSEIPWSFMRCIVDNHMDLQGWHDYQIFLIAIGMNIGGYITQSWRW
jgi:hypothetical protein